ncbi:hypothetical protein BaLi_c08480 [Bacillus paralicheniformis ATCC 9945a]|nr:hypothetical protein BaLi_c08480 [Bacillus paralicheniformis ATCC 9945a]
MYHFSGKLKGLFLFLLPFLDLFIYKGFHISLKSPRDDIIFDLISYICFYYFLFLPTLST